MENVLYEIDKSNLPKFYLEDYIREKVVEQRQDKLLKLDISNEKDNYQFEALCNAIKNSFREEWENPKNTNFEIILERQKKAILGHSVEVRFFKDKISEYLRLNNSSHEWFPPWYKNLVDAIFHENWGLAGLAPWVENQQPEYASSSSAKVIGERIYFLINGEMELQPQKISKERLQQLKKALILNEPKKKITDSYNDVFLLDNTRITIFGSQYTKKNKEVIIFRKFLIQDFSFEKQVELNTIPEYSVPFFKQFCNLGYNVLLVGGPNTGKSTFYETMQKYQNPTLQGIQIETDPEIDIDKILPGAPVMEILADGEDLKNVIKPILRADPDYIMLGEARDGVSLYVGVRAANKGTRRVKMTYHTTNVIDICGQIAEEIIEYKGGSLNNTIVSVARSFSYVFEFFYLSKQKNKKKLKSIHEIRYDEINHEISIHRICKYNIEKNIWEWAYHFGEDKKEIGMLESIEDVKEFENMIKTYAEKYPLQGETVFKPKYF